MAVDDYTDLATYRAFKQYRVSNTRDDGLITALIPEVSRAIDLYCHRWFWPKTMTQIYDFQDVHELRLRDDCQSVTEIVHAGGTEVLDPMYWILYPLFGPPYFKVQINKQWGHTFRWTGTDQAAISVTGVFGFLENGDTPIVIQGACNAWINYLVQAVKNAGIKSTSIGDYSVSFSAALDYLKNGPPNEVMGKLNHFRKTTIQTNVKY